MAAPNPNASRPSLLQPFRRVFAVCLHPRRRHLPTIRPATATTDPGCCLHRPAPPATAVSPIPPPPPHTFSAVDQSKFSPTPAMVEVLAALSHDPALLRLPVTLTILVIGSISIVLWRSLESLPREHFSSPFTTISLLVSWFSNTRHSSCRCTAPPQLWTAKTPSKGSQPLCFSSQGMFTSAIFLSSSPHRPANALIMPKHATILPGSPRLTQSTPLGIAVNGF